MKIDQIRELLKTDSYKFLKENEHLGSNIMLLTLGGSHAYGTSNENSDVDVRGITAERKKEILGLSQFEQFEHNPTDTVIYSFRKIVSLMLNSNPNVIELMGTEDDMIFYISKEGKMLKDNVNLFLSQLAKNSFGGYANQQLRRLQNALAHDHYPKDEKNKHIVKSMESMYDHFKNHYSDFGDDGFKMYVGNIAGTDESDILVDINLKGYPLKYYKGIQSEMNLCYSNYEKLNARNSKKDDVHLNKHAMHLIRLYLMAIDLFEKEKIVTYRKNDIPLLMDIRNGKYQNKDGSFSNDFFEMVDNLEKRFNYATKNTGLPEKPDYNKVEELVMDINLSILNK